MNARIAASIVLAARVAAAQQAVAAPPDQPVRPIAAPARGLPAEAASRAVTRFSFIVYGDTRGPQDGVAPQPVHAAIVESMLKTIATARAGPDPVRFVLQSGDAVVNGLIGAQWNVSFLPIVNRLALEGGVPYFLAPGNHDLGSSDSVNAPARLARMPNFLAATANTLPREGSPRRLKGYPTFAFGYGNTFVLGFDSNIAADTVQLAWAKGQLEHVDRKRYAHIVVFAHHPAISSGPHGGPTVERATAALREKWMPMFRANGVQLFFVGHEHFFEHWVERWRDASGAWRRLDQVVSGGGGAPIYSYRGDPDLTSYLAAGRRDSLTVERLVTPAPDSTGNPHHYVVVHVDGPRMWLDVVGVEWGASFAPYRTPHFELNAPAPPAKPRG